MRGNILEVLSRRVVVADGAMGSVLFEKGLGQDQCYDALNLEDPGLVASIHRDYIRAGAELIETNTFGGNRFKLERFLREADVAAINRRGAEIARECAGDEVWVAGAMGPLGRLRDQLVSREDMAAAFAEQARALAEGGADLIMLETFPGLDLLLIALEAVKGGLADPGVPSLPVAAQLVFTGRGRNLEGRAPDDCFRALREAGADIVGLNCGVGPLGSLETVKAASDPGCPLSVFPNAGLPERSGGRILYGSSPDYFARTTAECARHGARLIGGCCGTGPDHISALCKALKEQSGAAAPGRIESVPTEAPPVPSSGPTRFGAALGQKKMILVELDPPKHLDPGPALEAARALSEAGVDAITVAENPLAVPRLSNVALASLIRRTSGSEVIVHLTGRDRNLVGMQATVMGLVAQDLRNVLAVTGDPPTSGSEERVTGVYDVKSYELIAMLKGFNQGRNYFGDDMKREAGFSIGGAFNPNTRNIDLQVRRMERKIEHGAQFFMTQPVYSRERVDLILKSVEHLSVPVFLGIMPLASHRNAEFLHNEFPGIDIPDEIRERMRRAGDKGMEEGVDVAWELLEYSWPHFAGVYIIPPFNRHRMAMELMRRLRPEQGGES